MKNFLILIIVIVAIWLGFKYLGGNNTVPEPLEQQHLATVSGEVMYLERIALLEGSLVEVMLQDVSLADAPAVLISQSSIITQGENVPIPFELAYDPEEIDERHTYAVSARILVGGELRWISTDHTPVITNDNPTSDIVIILSGVGGSDVEILSEEDTTEIEA